MTCSSQYLICKALSAGYLTEHEFDPLVAVVAGAGAGSLYKSMNGPRAMAVYGSMGAAFAVTNQVGLYFVAGAGRLR
jgi:import inner membrane translocase subunit TIM23